MFFATKNKRYVASRSCPIGTSMYWARRSIFRKYNEIGCMTPEQSKLIKRNRNNTALNEVNRINFNRIILKRNQYFKPIKQPY